MSEKRIRWLIIASASLVMTLIVANLLALKIWWLFGVPVDAGILLFPLSYIVGDLLAEFYGEKLANFVALVAAMFGVLTLAVIALANQLLDYPGVDNSAFTVIASAAGRIFLASIVSFLLGQLANNRLFEAIRHRGGWLGLARDPFAVVKLGVGAELANVSPKLTDLSFVSAFAKRAIISSGAAHAVDAVVFEVFAFYGKLPFSEFCRQVVWAYLLGLTLELLLFPVTYYVAWRGHSAPCD